MNINGDTMNLEHVNIGMTRKGKLIHLDDDGEREFSPRTVRIIRGASIAFLAVVATVAILLLTGLMPPAPWSPMGQVEDPAPTFDWTPPQPVEPSPLPSQPEGDVADF